VNELIGECVIGPVLYIFTSNNCTTTRSMILLAVITCPHYLNSTLSLITPVAIFLQTVNSSQYLFVVPNGELVRGTLDNSVVVVRVLPTTVPLPKEGGADVREVEDLTFIVLGSRVDNQLERALKIQACCVGERRGEKMEEVEGGHSTNGGSSLTVCKQPGVQVSQSELQELHIVIGVGGGWKNGYHFLQCQVDATMVQQMQLLGEGNMVN